MERIQGDEGGGLSTVISFPLSVLSSLGVALVGSVWFFLSTLRVLIRLSHSHGSCRRWSSFCFLLGQEIKTYFDLNLPRAAFHVILLRTSFL